MLARVWKLLTSTFTIWADANATRMSAALTYFTMLSLAPLLMIAIAIAGYVYDDQLVESQIIQQVSTITTPEIARTIAGLIKNASEPSTGLVAGAISMAILLFGASGVFTQMYDTFNEIWGVSETRRAGIRFTIQKRMVGIGMVLVAGLLLMVALTLDSAIAYLNQLVGEAHPYVVTWLNLADRGLSFLLMPLLFSLIFWFFPAVKIYWRDVWPAGVLTAVLVAGSRYLIGLYLKLTTASEVYGAAGSLVVLLTWVYLTGLVVFLGAAFSHAWADTFGSRSEGATSGLTSRPNQIQGSNASLSSRQIPNTSSSHSPSSSPGQSQDGELELVAALNRSLATESAIGGQVRDREGRAKKSSGHLVPRRRFGNSD